MKKRLIRHTNHTESRRRADETLVRRAPNRSRTGIPPWDQGLTRPGANRSDPSHGAWAPDPVRGARGRRRPRWSTARSTARGLRVEGCAASGRLDVERSPRTNAWGRSADDWLAESRSSGRVHSSGGRMNPEVGPTDREGRDGRVSRSSESESVRGDVRAPGCHTDGSGPPVQATHRGCDCPPRDSAIGCARLLRPRRRGTPPRGPMLAARP